MRVILDSSVVTEASSAPTSNGERTGHFRKNVRASMACLPAWMQPSLTYVTGKPLPHQKPMLILHPVLHTVFATVGFLAMAGAEMTLLHIHPGLGIVLLAPYWIAMTGYVRRFQVVYAHHASHLALSRSRMINRVLSDILTTIPLIQNGYDYKRDHLSHHKRRDFSTRRDFAAMFLLKAGFRPSAPTKESWRTFWKAVISPKFHFGFFYERLRSNLLAPSLYRILMALIWILFLAFICFLVGGWVFVLCVVVPIGPLYQVSTLLNTITEHGWLGSEDGPANMEEYAARCWARFCGEPCPNPGSVGFRKWYLWSRWWIRSILIHIPTRIAVFVGDTPAHDWHHLAGYQHDTLAWPYAIYQREAAITEGKGSGLDEREVWGLWDTIDHSFCYLSRIPVATE